MEQGKINNNQIYLKPINYNEFIKRYKLKKITSDKTVIKVGGKKILDPEGVYSEQIFGPIGSSRRKKTFAYIELPLPVLNPYTFDFVSGGLISSILGKSVYQKFLQSEPFYLMEDGSFYTEPFHEEKNLKSIKEFRYPLDFYHFLKDEKNTNEFMIMENYVNTVKGNGDILKTLIELVDTLFTDKLLVMPAAFRDVFIKDGKVLRENPISQLYQEIIRISNKYKNIRELYYKNKPEHTIKSGNDINTNNKSDNNSEDIQNVLSNLNNLLSDEEPDSGAATDNKTDISEDPIKSYYSKIHPVLQKLALELVGILGFGQKGKLLRSAKLSKRLDHTVRLVLTHDKNLKPNEVKVPWMFLIKLYEPFVVHHITKNPKYSDIYTWVKSQIGDKFSDRAFRELTNNIVKNPKTVPQQIKEKLIELEQEIIDGVYDGYEKYVLVLRHPVENDNSTIGMKPVIDKEDVYVASLPQIIFGTLGADCNWDLIEVKVNNDRFIKCHIKDLPKYVNHREIENYTRVDGVHVRILELLEPVEILAYDREKNEFVYDKVVFWHEHSNINTVKIIMEDGTEFISSTTKEYLIDENKQLLKPSEEIIGKKVLHRDGYKKIINVEPANKNIGWDITTLITGTYVDAYGYVKKQCDGNLWSPSLNPANCGKLLKNFPIPRTGGNTCLAVA